MPSMLRSVGLQVKCHRDYFQPEEEDHIWIPQCAANGWIIITSDKGIENDPVNRQAVLESKARVFIMDDNNSRAGCWAAAIIVSRTRIFQIVFDNDGPFFMDVSRETSMLVKTLRRPCLKPGADDGATMIIHEAEISPRSPEKTGIIEAK
jgi:hypothetical protein